MRTVKGQFDVRKINAAWEEWIVVFVSDKGRCGDVVIASNLGETEAQTLASGLNTSLSEVRR
jgi:hypothetical protein